MSKIEIRSATAMDIEKIVNVHKKAFCGFFTTMLGSSFLCVYYGFVLNCEGGIILVAETDAQEIAGFVSGAVDRELFYLEMKRSRLKMALTMIEGILSRPWLIARAIASYRFAKKSVMGISGKIAELSSIAVIPEYSGKGVGKALLSALMDHLYGKANVVELTTDRDGNDNVNFFYRNNGFQMVGTELRSRGRVMNVYRRTIA